MSEVTRAMLAIAEARIERLEKAMRDWLEHNGCSDSTVSCNEIHGERFRALLSTEAPTKETP